MTQATTPAPTAASVTAPAISVVDLGAKACEAYGRPDLAHRLARTRGALNDPSVHIVVAGEFKQGKSSLVNMTKQSAPRLRPNGERSSVKM